MSNLNISVKLIFKNRTLAITTMVFFAFVNIFHILFINLAPLALDGIVFLLYSSLMLSMIYFVFFMFISYEYFSQLKTCNLDECLSGIHNGKVTVIFNQFIVMLLLNLLNTIVILSYNIARYVILNINQTQYLVHIILNILLNVFLLSLLGIIIGLFSSLFLRRLKAYIIITLITLLSSGVFESIASTVYNNADKNIYPVYEFFNFYPPSLKWSTNYNFGFSLLPYRVELLLIWIFALSAIILFYLSRNHSKNLKSIACVCLALCVTNFVLYVQPSSKIVMSNNPDYCLIYDYFYYAGKIPKEEVANFEIKSYDLDIKITNKLSVRAALSVDKENLPKYHLTLYHGYKVKQITDQDNKQLDFVQNGDYIEISKPSNSSINKLILNYDGYSPKFYSNSQGSCLPGYFPYYPHSGYKKVYLREKQGFNKVLLNKPTQFNVKVKSNKKIYSNLTENENGSFSGNTNGLTLMSGFLKQTNMFGIDIIYPYLANEYSPATMERSMREFLEIKNDDNVIDKIFIIPNLNLSDYESITLYNDYMICPQLLSLTRTYHLQFVSDYKVPLYYCVYFYHDNMDHFLLRSSNESSLPEEERYGTILLSKIQTLGEEAVLQKTYAYLRDSNDKRTIEEFLKQLKKEG